MASTSSPLLWEVVKNHNSHMRKSAVGGGARFSAEPGNLYNLSSYKHSALINGKNVHVEAAGPSGLSVVKSRGKTAQQPKKSKAVVVIKKNPRQALKSVGKDVASYRPDLKKATVARASAVLKSLRAKSAKASK